MAIRPRLNIVGLLLGGTLLVGVTGCAAKMQNHGYAPVSEELAEIRSGQDTRGSVRRKVGRPGGTGIFTDEGWFYVASQVEHYTFYEPEVIDRRVVAILFDERDVVKSVNSYGLEDGRIIDLETNTTPTFGRELTIIEQAFGNIGVTAEDLIGN